MELPYALWRDDSLLASRDRKTGEIVFPALPHNSPLVANHDTVSIKGAGEVYSFTVIHPGKKSGEAPYALGLVDFAGPVRIFGRLCGAARPVIGDKYVPRPHAEFGYVFEAVQA